MGVAGMYLFDLPLTACDWTGRARDAPHRAKWWKLRRTAKSVASIARRLFAAPGPAVYRLCLSPLSAPAAFWISAWCLPNAEISPKEFHGHSSAVPLCSRTTALVHRWSGSGSSNPDPAPVALLSFDVWSVKPLIYSSGATSNRHGSTASLNSLQA